MGDLIFFGAIAFLVAFAYGLIALYTALGWILASVALALYAACATVTAGAAGRVWKPDSPSDEAIYYIAATALWPLFWIIVVVFWLFRALYRLGARE